MRPLSLLLVLASATAADLPPEELIGRLGSPDRVVREEATRTLEELGEKALPALRASRDQAREPEARDRLANLIARVEARLLDRPTMVVLDVDDRPLGEAVQALSARSGFPLSLGDPSLAARRVTVRPPGPLPFWEALDRLGRAGHVRHDPGQRIYGLDFDPGASTIRLVAGEPPAFTAYSGPLRIHLFATHRHRDEGFETTDASRAPKRSVTVTVEVQAFAEPGRFLNPNGRPRLDAVDDRGRAIAPQPAGGAQDPVRGGNSWIVPGRLSLLHWHIPLGVPENRSGSPVKLRGALPVVISSRRPDPLLIPLAGAAGKTFRQGPGFLRIQKVSGQNGRTTAVDLTLGEGAIPEDGPRNATGPEADYIADFLPDRLEFEDAEGHPLSWLIIGHRWAPRADYDALVQIWVSGATPPARLRIYRLHRLATEIPFEFANVPAP